MDSLEQSDKDELIRLSDMVEKWEAAYHSLPGKGKRFKQETDL
ncbi:hypothetical protein [Bacteroides sp.]